MISCKDKEIIKIFLTDWHKLTQIKKTSVKNIGGKIKNVRLQWSCLTFI